MSTKRLLTPTLLITYILTMQNLNTETCKSNGVPPKMVYKIVLIGPAGSGKSTYLKKIKTGEFDPRYICTMGVDVKILTFPTNYGDIIFKVWDCAGKEEFGGSRDQYYQGADGAILFVDHISPDYSPELKFINLFDTICPGKPIFTYHSKRKLADGSITLPCEKDLIAPFQYMAIKFTRLNDIVITGEEKSHKECDEARSNTKKNIKQNALKNVRGNSTIPREHTHVEYINLDDGSRIKITTHTTIEYEP